MKVIHAQEDYIKNEKDVVCFLSGSCNIINKWRNNIISFLNNIEEEKTLNLDNLVIIDPFLKNFPSNEDELAIQVKWELEMLDQTDILAVYFDDNRRSGSKSPYSFFELGRSMTIFKEKFGNNKLVNRLLIFAHPDYSDFNHISFEIKEATRKWKNPLSVESINKSINTLSSKILESYIKLVK